jgi:hypothetical protein
MKTRPTQAGFFLEQTAAIALAFAFALALAFAIPPMGDPLDVTIQ